VCKQESSACKQESRSFSLVFVRHNSVALFHLRPVCKQESSVCKQESRSFSLVFVRHNSVALFHLRPVCKQESPACKQESRSFSLVFVRHNSVALFHLRPVCKSRALSSPRGRDFSAPNSRWRWMAMHECFSLVFIGHNWSFFGLVVNMASSESPLCLAIWSLLTGPHCGAYSREIT